MKTTTKLPKPDSPTSYRGHRKPKGVHPNINVFGLAPVRKASELEAGDSVNVNIAQYVDPNAELDYQWHVSTLPRWVQGLTVTVDEIKDVYHTTDYWQRGQGGVFMPADRIYAGRVTNHDANVPVVGLMHPQHYGWLAFDQETLGEQGDLRTIADLKAHIGQISLDQAAQQNETLWHHGEFHLDGKVYS